MEHFLNENDDHNSSFFQPPTNDDETDLTVSRENNQNKPIIPKDETKERNRRMFNIDEEANIKLQVLVSNFSDEQLDRYETYRRSAFSKVSIKRLMHSITGTVPSSNVVIAMAGIAKVFVGEIVEEALEVQRQENPENKPTPLEPRHLREAHRKINNRTHRPQRTTWKSKRKSRFS